MQDTNIEHIQCFTDSALYVLPQQARDPTGIGRTKEMTWDQISKRWRKLLANKLQERYGLAEEDAKRKADAWLQWVGKQPSPKPRTVAMTASGRCPPSHHGSSIPSSQLTSRAAGRS